MFNICQWKCTLETHWIIANIIILANLKILFIKSNLHDLCWLTSTSLKTVIKWKVVRTWNWVCAGNSNDSPRNVNVNTCFSPSYTPGWVAPKDWSICSIVGETSGQLNNTSLKWRTMNADNDTKCYIYTHYAMAK